ncbi:MAG: ABC transporter substrate-binding protein, partial [bacterium]|nr:ABC transporter substrate-binding protein [bacterium]
NSSDVFGSVTNNVYPAALSLKREYRQDLPPTLDVHFILAFNIPITGLDPSDFQLTQSEGLSGCHVESIEPINPTTYRVKVARGTGAGVLAIALLDDNSIRAVASNEPLATHDEQPEGGIAGESYTLLPSVLHFHAILPLDGVHALNGQKAKTGFDQAAAEITRNGGIDGTQVLVMYHDTGSTEEGATQAVQTALNDPLTFGILGAISSQTLAIAPSAVEKQRVLASPATSFEMRNHPRYVLKTSPLDDYQANAMIHHLHANDIKKVIVLADHSPYGADFLKILQHAHAIEVLHSHTYPTGHLHDNSDAVLAAKAALAPASDEIVAGIVIGYAPDANAFLHAVQDDTRFPMCNGWSATAASSKRHCRICPPPSPPSILPASPPPSPRTSPSIPGMYTTAMIH